MNATPTTNPETSLKLLKNALHGMNVSAELKTTILDLIPYLDKHLIPKEITEIHVDEYVCPSCGAENSADEKIVHDKFCPVCGQKLFVKGPADEY